MTLMFCQGNVSKIKVKLNAILVSKTERRKAEYIPLTWKLGNIFSAWPLQAEYWKVTKKGILASPQEFM